MYKRLALLVGLLSLPLSSALAEASYAMLRDIPYKQSGDAYEQERCRLDLYAPENQDGFATLIWFHGGGLKNGEKEIPNRLRDQGLAIVAVNYRLYPRAQASDPLDDAAAAVAWTFDTIASHGGDPDKIFVSGHSAGGYLATMVAYDRSLLATYAVDANLIAGVIPYSGHTITHMTLREEAGIDSKQPIIDVYAPLFHARGDAPPTLLITGDRELELLGRYEENAYFWRVLQLHEHPDATLYELDGYGHNMLEPAHPLALKFIERLVEQNAD